MQTARLLRPESPFINDHRVPTGRQRSFSDVRITPKELDHWGLPAVLGGSSHALSNEAQTIWESLMTLRHTRQMPISNHVSRALPLLTHPSLPLPPALQVLVFTSSLSPQLRALISTCHPTINSLDEAVEAARLAEKAKQRMDWIGHTMAAAEAYEKPRPRPDTAARPSTGRPSTGRPPTAPQRPATARKRSFEDDPEGRTHKKKKVTMQLDGDPRYSPQRSPQSPSRQTDESRPGSSESYGAGSPDSGRSGMDYLADAAVEAAREQLQRL